MTALDWITQHKVIRDEVPGSHWILAPVVTFVEGWDSVYERLKVKYSLENRGYQVQWDLNSILVVIPQTIRKPVQKTMPISENAESEKIKSKFKEDYGDEIFLTMSQRYMSAYKKGWLSGQHETKELMKSLLVKLDQANSKSDTAEDYEPLSYDEVLSLFMEHFNPFDRSNRSMN